MADPDWRYWARVAASVATVVVLWFLAHGLVVGTLSFLGSIGRAERFEEFSWVAPRLALPAQEGPEAVQLIGRTDVPQWLTLSCGRDEVDRRWIGAGYFDITLRMTVACPDQQPSIAASHSSRPSEGAGSRDERELSYQLFALWIGAAAVPLSDIVAWQSGAWAVEPAVPRQAPAEILALSWDAWWYQDLAQRGYIFDGDGAVQQNVAWPFLFPALSAGYAAVTGVTSPEATLGLNRLLVLFDMLGLLALGLRLGVAPALSVVPPALLAFSPFNAFLFGGFSEPLFVGLGTLAALAAVSRWWLVAGIAVGLMAATRFVGVLAIVPVALYWLALHRGAPMATRAVVLVGFGALALAGVFVDMLVKAVATGYPLAAFQIRGAWQLPGWDALARLWEIGTLASGNFYPLVGLNLLLAAFVAFVGVQHVRRAGFDAAGMTMATGTVLVVATLVLNPDVNAAGRYLLPLTIALPGLLAAQPASIAVLAGWGTAGAAAIGMILARFYLGQAPY